MKIIGKEIQFCPECGEDHEVTIIELNTREKHKDEEIYFTGQYCFCELSKTWFESDDMNESNTKIRAELYRKKKGFLSEEDVINIRKRYNVSQEDFSLIMGWGDSLIYYMEEYHWVQDAAHDEKLRKVKDDPAFFLELLNKAKAKNKISEECYNAVKATIG